MVSAPGRRFEGDSKITDLLYLCHAHLKSGVTMALMAEYLGFEFADAKDWLFFGYDGKVDFHKTNDALRKIISETPKWLSPAFTEPCLTAVYEPSPGAARTLRAP